MPAFEPVLQAILDQRDLEIHEHFSSTLFSGETSLSTRVCGFFAVGVSLLSLPMKARQ